MSVTGIDIGTKNIRCALYEENKTNKILEFEVGKRLFEYLEIFNKIVQLCVLVIKEIVYLVLQQNLLYFNNYFIQQSKNINYTIGYILDLVGKEYNKELLKYHHGFNIIQVDDNHFGIEIDHIKSNNEEEKKIFTIEEIFFMLLDYSIKFIKTQYKIVQKSDIVIGVPPYFNKNIDEGIIQYVKHMSHKCEVINNYFGYTTTFGVESTDIKGSIVRRVIFVDMGFNSSEVCCAEYRQVYNIIHRKNVQFVVFHMMKVQVLVFQIIIYVKN